MSEPAISVELSCQECRAHDTAELSAAEFQELSRTWKIERTCKACQKRTSWTFAEADVEAEEQMDFWDWLATTGASFERSQAAPQDERRKEPRVGLQVPLRVARANGEEEALMSENISRSGLCFASSRNYTVGESLRITLQPEAAAGVQTRTGTIVRLTAAEDGTSLYGVRLET